jgi:hypothetical protein
MKRASLVAAMIVAGVGSTLGVIAACGSSSSNPGGPGANGDGGDLGDGNNIPILGGGEGGNGGGDGSNGACTGLQCQIHSCPGVTTGTTVTGHVYDPAGNNPLYNVVVYVPNTTVDPLPAAPTNECGACNSLYSGQPVAAGITDATGKFTMNNSPEGTNIPLVVQIGKWRTQLVIPKITSCGTGDANNLDKTLAPYKIALPQVAGVSAAADPTKGLQQDIPNIAISTGGADSLECLLRRIGVSASEYTPGAGGAGHIHIFQGAGEFGNDGYPAAKMATGVTPASSLSLWDSASDLSPYDILILSCEGQPTSDLEPDGGVLGPDGGLPQLTVANQTALQDFTAAGGRAFLSHFHYAWLNTGPFATPALAGWGPGPNPIEDKGSTTSTTMGDIATTFPKGLAFDQWLGVTDALTGTQLPIVEAKDNAVVSAADTPSQAWITADQNAILVNSNTGVPTTTSAAGATEYFTFDTPIGGAGTDDAGAPTYCGRVVYSDLHVGAASGDYGGGTDPTPTVPTGCANQPLSPQEKALEFMLFDLSSCVTPDTGPSQGPPPVIVPVK